MTATFEDVRRIALGLPETEEVIAWGDRGDLSASGTRSS